jgi:hypothetical protein
MSQVHPFKNETAFMVVECSRLAVVDAELLYEYLEDAGYLEDEEIASKSAAELLAVAVDNDGVHLPGTALLVNDSYIGALVMPAGPAPKYPLDAERPPDIGATSKFLNRKHAVDLPS